MYLKVRKRAWSIFYITLSIFILSFVVTLHNLLNHMHFVYMKYVKSSTCSFVFVYTLYLSHWIYQMHVHIIVIENRTEKNLHVHTFWKKYDLNRKTGFVHVLNWNNIKSRNKTIWKNMPWCRIFDYHGNIFWKKSTNKTVFRYKYLNDIVVLYNRATFKISTCNVEEMDERNRVSIIGEGVFISRL